MLKTVDQGNNGSIDERTVSAVNDRDQTTLSGADGNNDGVPDAATATTTAFDANGSTVTETTGTAVKHYVWDLRNRLVGLDANGNNLLNDNGDATFAYDSNGVRVGKSVVGEGATTFLQDTNNPTGYSQVLEERAANGQLLRTYELGSDVIAQASGSTVSRLLYDAGGSTRAIVDATGQVATDQVYAYDAFGVRIADPSQPLVTPATALLYRGELWDATLAQYQLRKRYFDPQLGAFKSQDPTLFGSGEILNANLYRYAGANPVLASDPSGLAFTIGELNVSAAINFRCKQRIPIRSNSSDRGLPTLFLRYSLG